MIHAFHTPRGNGRDNVDGLVALCAAGGMAPAILIERV